MSEKTCAVIVEPIQGEGGVIPASPAFLQGLRTLCDQFNALLIFDEVQTGVGRTGDLYAYQHYGVVPDILTTAKALGGGFPIGAMLTTARIATHFTPGTHGTTYGGNALAGAVAGCAFSLINTPEMLAGVKHRHALFVAQLDELNHHLGLFRDIRGMGLLIGCELNEAHAGKAKLISQRAAQEGVMILIAGAGVVRFAPALNIPEEDIREGLSRLKRACEALIAEGAL